MGRTASEILLHEIQHPGTPVQTIHLDTELIVRESTAPPR
jgi:DNA-binding LacI/PurR family transcriptional regulator